jgi:putative intracellular protease/amidase
MAQTFDHRASGEGNEMADPHLKMIRDVTPSAEGCEARGRLSRLARRAGGGLPRGRRSRPTFETPVRSGVDQEVIVDGNLVSSRKPDDIPTFNRAMIDLFGQAHRQSRRTA